jgi:putative sigma-54 modulation protein
MQYIISGKNIDVTNALKDIAIQKLSKLEKYFVEETEVQATMSVQKQLHVIEVTIPIKGSIIRAEEKADSMYVAIDKVIDILERQLVKHRKKLINRYRNNGAFRKEFLNTDIKNEEEEQGIDIVRTKRFAIKPMDAEEACLEMDMLGHDFFVFRNGETNEVNVVYKRKSGAYGLIEPEF